jgi:ribosomal protein S6--L-glutamate ligase
MQLVSFDVLRCLDIPGLRYLKPAHYFRDLAAVRQADWILFPEYWQVNSLIYGLGKRIFPGPASYHLGHDKVEQTRALLTVAPGHVPETLILPPTATARDEILDQFSFPFVAKQVRSSRGDGVYLIEAVGDLQCYLDTADVVYVQEYLPIRRDLRVVWLGRKVLTAYWRESGDGFHFNVARGGVINFETVPEAALLLVERVATCLGIDHAGFDVACVGSHYYILEFNVLFGLEALNRQGIRCGEAILRYLEEQDNEPGKPVRPRPLAA